MENTLRQLINELYSQEEIEKYFGGEENSVATRAAVFSQWREEWGEAGRKISVKPGQLREMNELIKRHKIRKVDYAMVGRIVYFRYDDDYFAIRIALG